MQFSIMTVFALAAVAIAIPTGIVAERNIVERNVVRSNGIADNAPVMSDANGNVVPFSAKDVYVPTN